MARQKTSPLEDLILIVSKLPWWAAIILAMVAYLVLHSLASRPLVTMTGSGQMGAAAVRGLYTTLAKLGQYILPLAFGVGAGISAYKAASQKKLYNNVAKCPGVASLNDMSWGNFEQLVGEYYRRKGFQVTREGGDGHDGGIDLVLRQENEIHLVQCKQWKAYKVGVQLVREFYGVMASRGAAGGYFVTSGEFTNDAKIFAERLNIELVGGRKLKRMIDTMQESVLTRVTVNSSRSGVAKVAPVSVDARSPNVQEVPVCPKCKGEMTKRVARHGTNFGQEFWGCSAYPKCKGTRPVDESGSQKSFVTIPQSVRTLPAPKRSNCPDCGTEMALRQFQSGSKIGQSFYGCVPCKKGWSLEQVGEV